MHRPALVLCLAALAMAPMQPTRADVGAKVQRTATTKVDAETKNFVKNARIGGNFEVVSSKLALDKTQNADIRAFAERMVTDHTKAGQQLDQTVSSENIVVDEPSSRDKLDKKHQAMLDKLRGASANQFDRLYVQMQQSAHDEAVKLFNKYSKGGDNTALKNFAQETLPTLQDHKKHINGMNIS
jgi:putative membrane protein